MEKTDEIKVTKVVQIKIMAHDHLAEHSSIFISNTKNKNILVNSVAINGVDCDLMNSNVIEAQNITEIDADCSFSKNQKLSIIVATNQGIITHSTYYK